MKLLKTDIILFFLLVFVVFVDILNGIYFYLFNSNLLIASLYRGSIVAISSLFVFFSNRVLKISFHILFIIFFWVLLLAFWWIFSDINLLSEMNSFLRITYALWLFSLLIYFSPAIERRKVLGFIELYLGIVSTAIYFSFVTKIGISTHSGYTFGTSSFFIAANTLGISVLSLLAILLFRDLTKKKFVFYLIIGVSLFLIGSLTAIVGVILLFTIRLIAYLFFQKSTNLSQLIRKNLISILFFIGLIQLVYIVYDFLSEFYFYNRKVALYLEQGPRAELTNVAHEYLVERPLYENLFGEGKSSFLKNYASQFSEGYKAKDESSVENDIYDFIGAYGIVFFILLCSWYFKYYITAIKIFLAKKDLTSTGLCLSFTLLFGHSFVAGHVLGTPMALNSLAILCFLTYKYTFKNE